MGRRIFMCKVSAAIKKLLFHSMVLTMYKAWFYIQALGKSSEGYFLGNYLLRVLGNSEIC